MIQLKDLKKIDGFKNLSNENISLDFNVKISTDTRSIKQGDTFLAIEGENFKPLIFLKNIEQTNLVICEENIFNLSEAKNYSGKTFVFVENSIKYLQNVASFIAEKFIAKGCSIIAICGSNGKTTTKEMLYHIMSKSNPNVICTQNNNNNHIGVPLTLLDITESTQYCILELGSNHPGEIKILCEIARPNIGIVTNVGDTHLEFFGSREEVLKDEGYLYQWIKESKYKNKKFFLNDDDELLNKYSKNLPEVVSYGKMGDDYKLHCTSTSGQVNLNGVKYVLDNEHVTGEHNFFNLCVATIINKELLGGQAAQICSFANSFRPTANRSEWISLNSSKIFLDAYNAKPNTIKVAIKGFCDSLRNDKVKLSDSVLILGDMNELGGLSEDFHREIGHFLSNEKIKNVVFVGRFAQFYNEGFLQLGHEYKNIDDLKKRNKNLINKYKRVFIKGSRSLQLESILDI